MDLFPNADQQQIIDTVDAFFSRRFSIEVVRAQANRPHSIDGGDWRSLAELGCFALGLPAELGGAGAGMVDELLLARELGRHLVPGPIIASIVGAHALSRHRPDIVAKIVDGTTRVALAEPYPASRGTDEPRYLVTDLTDDAVVLLCDGDDWSVFDHQACTDVRPLRGVDPSSRLVSAVLSDTKPLTLTCDSGLRFRAHVLIAAAMSGIAAATTAASAEYAKNRVQFGQPIGAFQAVKHRCAEMAVRTEAAFSQTVYAGLVVDAGGADAQFQAAAARLVATSAAGQNCADNIQNHGGIGFTAECDAHLYLRRWLALQTMLGDRITVADELATLDAVQ